MSGVSVPIRVTHLYTSGDMETWTQLGADQPARVARLRAAGVPFRRGPGWIERDIIGSAEPELDRVERVEWLDG